MPQQHAPFKRPPLHSIKKSPPKAGFLLGYFVAFIEYMIAAKSFLCLSNLD